MLYGVYDVARDLPWLFIPIRAIEEANESSDYVGLVLAVATVILILYQLGYCFQILVIILTGRTYQQLNNTDKYEHLY